VLKVAPPLVVTDAQLDAFVLAVRTVVELAHSPGAFWSEALGLARRAFRGRLQTPLPRPDLTNG
jgi:hypothetical protein